MIRTFDDDGRREAGHTVMRRLGIVTLFVLVAGCSVPRPFTDEFYAPARIRRGAVTGGPVAVVGFADERGTDPGVVFTLDRDPEPPRVERASVPVGEGVARAFARGLRARGFDVVDAANRRWSAGAPAPAPLVLSGRVSDFGITMSKTGFLGAGTRQRLGCRVTLELLDAGGRRLWQREYTRVVEGDMLIGEPFPMLARALADVVEDAVPDVATALAAAR